MNLFGDDDEWDFEKDFSDDEWLEEEGDDDDWFVPTEDLIEGITVHSGWEQSFVECDLCSHRWMAVRPEGTPKLECPNCEQITYFEEVEDDEEDY
jgi:hypothetical protein